MYKVTFARHHYKYIRPNRDNEGSFTLTFNNIKQIARYMIHNRNRVHFVCSNLTYPEKVILAQKLESVYRKELKASA